MRGVCGINEADVRSMELKDVIDARRAYRALEKVEITDGMVEDLAAHAGLAPSCYNNQPWKFVFVRSQGVLEEMFGALSRGNEWAHRASMIIAVLARKEDDCVIKDRQYHQFDTGLATAFLMLRATDMGLVAHPIAGYSPSKVRSILEIPGDMEVLALLVVGRKSEDAGMLSEAQKEAEKERPGRKALPEFAYRDRYEGT